MNIIIPGQFDHYHATNSVFMTFDKMYKVNAHILYATVKNHQTHCINCISV